MEKPACYFWSLRPVKSFKKLLITLKIAVILLFCWLSTYANSFTAEVLKSSSNTRLSVLSSFQQQMTITGLVTDASTGGAMPGVNVVVKGTSIGYYNQR